MAGFFLRSKWIILAGLIFGVLGALAVNWGNPLNMGICVACFLRDISGGIKLHTASIVQYIRHEIIGFVFGSLGTSLIFKEWKSRGGSSPIIRFFLGVFVMVGALIFLGCPIRMGLRLAGGDLNGLIALAGMIVGVLVGVFFLRRGFNLGRAVKLPAVVGTIIPVFCLLLLIFLIAKPAFIAFSESGPGSQYMPWILGLGIGILVGFMFQRTRFCSVGGWRDIFLVKDFYLFSGIAAFIVAALATNYIVGNFSDGGLAWASGTDVAYHWGFTKQAVSLPMVDAEGAIIWNQPIAIFFGMGLLGIAATMLGGCPLRNLVLSGEGDSDAGVTVLGYIVGAAFAHNWLISSSGTGLGAWAPVAIAGGWVFCIIVGFAMRERA
jgi:hypothetical protein